MNDAELARIELFVGIDWATKAHEVCVLDASGKVVKRRSVDNTGVGLQQLMSWLLSRVDEVPERVAVGIEVPRGAVVESTLERGFRVFSLNPKQLDRFRDRFFPSGAKDDSKDAFVLARCLMTDLDCYREAHVDDPVVMQLREHVRMHEELKRERLRLSNQLRALLLRYRPELLDLSSSLDEAWFLELLERAPMPDKAARIRVGTIARILKKHRIRRLQAEDVVAVLRAPPLHLAPGSAEAASAHVAMLIPRLRLVREQAANVRKRLDALLVLVSGLEDEEGEEREHRDADIILSLPGAGTIVTATMLGEASGAIRERDYNAMRAHGGLAPVTRQTGTQRHGKRSRRRPVVRMRRAANGRLRNALYNMAAVAMMHDPASTRYYRRLRAAGHTHARALRSVADRLLRILFAMLRDDTLYDASHFDDPGSQESRAA